MDSAWSKMDGITSTADLRRFDPSRHVIMLTTFQVTDCLGCDCRKAKVLSTIG